MSRIETIGNCTLYLGDCREILPLLPKVDLVLTDPPYGIGMDGGNVGYKGFNDFEKLDWDKETPSKHLIDACVSLGNNAILWGGNYFDLPPTRCYLIWDKGAGFKGRTYAEAELAWTSMDANVRVLQHDPLANRDYSGKYHPTMKPVRVIEWCLDLAPKPTSTVADPFMGSGTTGVACANMGKTFYGIEREPKYFDIACKRIEQAYAQQRLFA